MNLAIANYLTHRDRILPLIEKAAERNRHDFADNIDRALLSGRAFLFLMNNGFFVLEPNNDRSIEVAFGFSFGGNSCLEFQPSVEQLARDIHATHLYFHTTLRGFAILAGKMGYKKKSQSGRVTTWIKEVPYGKEQHRS
jgi:hypothetical protein